MARPTRLPFLLTALAAACASPHHTAPDTAPAAPDLARLAQRSTAAALAEEPVAAVQVYLRAIAEHPDDPVLLDALVNTAADQRLLPLALLALRVRSDAIGQWYLGRVRYLLAADLPPDRALRQLDAAMQCFDAAMQQQPDYRDTSEQWLAMCLGKKGNIAFRAGDLAAAQDWLLQATRLCPDRIGVDLGGGDSARLGLLRLGERTMRDTARTEAMFHAAAALADTDLDLLNNAAVYARDRGVQLERAGDPAAATTMFERSYAAYQRAVAQAPGDVRLRNDCALVAVHHLRCDWYAAKAMLEGAIADGERALRDAPPATAAGRRDLDEAVGDCYENLALWHLKHGQDAAAAKAAALASMQHHPGKRRGGAQRHLQAAERLLRGK